MLDLTLKLKLVYFILMLLSIRKPLYYNNFKTYFDISLVTILVGKYIVRNIIKFHVQLYIKFNIGILFVTFVVY